MTNIGLDAKLEHAIRRIIEESPDIPDDLAEVIISLVKKTREGIDTQRDLPFYVQQVQDMLGDEN